MDKEAFIRYLRNTLIPDLLESGHYATAEDFETSCRFMEEGKLKPHLVDSEEQTIAYCNEWKEKA